MSTKKSVISFLNWLEENDPFVYDVVSDVLKKKGIALAGWEDILSSVGDAVAKVGTAYLGYRAAKSTIKIQELQAKYGAQKEAPTVKDVAPTPNESAISDILKRLKLAEKNMLQPQIPYAPFIQPQKINNYPVVVKKTSNLIGGVDNKMLLVGSGLLVALLLVLKRG